VAEKIYGQFPGTFDFTTNQEANEAANAVNIELNDAGAQTVGAGGSAGLPFYRIGFDSELVGEDIPVVIFLEAVKDDGPQDPWVTNIEPDGDSYNFGLRMWADFTLAGPAPDPVTIGGTVTGLEGSGLVLQNNGTDDLPTDSNGPFEFATPLTPDTFYNVTVATNPSNPAQTCSVENGSGQVPTVNVTDVAVSCTDVVLGEVIKAAAEGDTLTDGTLDEIEAEGKVSINNLDQVAFHGRVEIEGGLLDETFRAVFTSDGQTTQVAAREASELPDETTVEEILESGGVAINDFGDVVFHGRTDNVKAVFSQNGLVAMVGDNLADGTTTLKEIWEDAGVAINTYAFDVAFHGGVDNPDLPGVLVDAVFVGQAPVAEGEEMSSE